MVRKSNNRKKQRSDISLLDGSNNIPNKEDVSNTRETGKIKVQAGFDISTSAIGICILEESTGKLIHLDNVKMTSTKLTDEYDKSDFFEKELLSWWKDEWVPSKIYIEKAAMMFTPGMSSAQTIMTLGRFNGIISNILYKKFGIKPTMIGVTSARSKLGIKIDRKDKSKTTKDKVFEIVKTMHPEFPWITHIAKNGKFKDQLVYDKENYDMCDAFVIVAGGRLLA